MHAISQFGEAVKLTVSIQFFAEHHFFRSEEVRKYILIILVLDTAHHFSVSNTMFKYFVI
jgi:hypothetical protein